MFKNILITIIGLLKINTIFLLIENDLNFIKLSFTDNYSVPIINTQINNKKIETSLDNNLNFNYLSTKNINLTDIDFHHNSDKINIKNKKYDAYFYIGNISVYDENNYIQMNNFNSFIIDDKLLISSITAYYLIQQFMEKSLISQKRFYLDIEKKLCLFGELNVSSEEYKRKSYFDKFIHSVFYSNNSNGVFKGKLNSIFINNNYIPVSKNISFKINEKNTFISYSTLDLMIQDEKISNLDCSLLFIEKEGTTIKCPKRNINKLPNLFFVYNNYTFKIPFKLLFEDYDQKDSISLIRSSIKVQNSAEEVMEDDPYEEEWAMGYSIIKLFNFTVFDYDERSIGFYSDSLISLRPPSDRKRLTKNILYLLNFVLGFSSIFLFFVRIKIDLIPIK
jgi:hypothetical protein